MGVLAGEEGSRGSRRFAVCDHLTCYASISDIQRSWIWGCGRASGMHYSVYMNQALGATTNTLVVMA